MDVAQTVNDLNHKHLTPPLKQKIIEWFKENGVDYDGMKAMKRKDFISAVGGYCQNKKINGALAQLYKQLTQASSKKKENVSNNDRNKPISFIQRLKNEMDAINDPKMNEHKDKIIEHIQKNGIDYAKATKLKRKNFINGIQTHCGDKKLAKGLGKVWKHIFEAKSNEKIDEKEEEEKYENKEEEIDSNVIEKSIAYIGEELENSDILEFHQKSIIEYFDVNKGDIDKMIKSKEGQKKLVNNIIDYCLKKEDYEVMKTEDDVDKPMPTYINRSIWFRSDDEALERLVDRSVKEVLHSSLWQNPKFVADLYSEETFNKSVTEIYKENFNFFDYFVKKQFRRELLLEDMRMELRKNEKDPTEDEDENEKTMEENRRNKIEATHTIYNCYHNSDDDIGDVKYNEDTQQTQNKNSRDSFVDTIRHGINTIIPGNSLEIVDDLQMIQEGYHIYPKQNANVPASVQEKKSFDVCVDQRDKDFDWVFWVRKQKTEAAQQAKKHGQKLFGYWDVINYEDDNKNVIPLAHILQIFELLRHYYAMKIDYLQQREKSGLTSTDILSHGYADNDRLSDIYVCVGPPKMEKIDINIFIHDETGNKEETHYRLRWWNSKKRNDCNAFAIEHFDASKEEWKERYFMRFHSKPLMEGSDKSNVHWMWYDNNHAKYMPFSDYDPKCLSERDKHKDGLLRKQVEASYLGFVNSNFPWSLFNDDGNRAKNAKKHSFNRPQLTHLKPARESNNRGMIPTLGYYAHFTPFSFETTKKRHTHKRTLSNRSFKLDASKLTNKEKITVNLILNMEQVSVNQNNMLFRRNIKRMEKFCACFDFYTIEFPLSEIFLLSGKNSLLARLVHIYVLFFVIIFCLLCVQSIVAMDNL